MKLYKYNKTKLQYEPANIPVNFFKTILAVFTLFLFLGLAIPTQKEYVTNTETVLIVNDLNEFSEEKLIEEINKLNFKFPHIVLAQSILETGHYKSKIFKENNNLFGMKEARVRLNLAKGTQHGHAYYDDWKESLTDYALWYSTYANKCKNEKQLYKLLNKQYAEAKYYPQALQRIIKRDQLESKFKK